MDVNHDIGIRQSSASKAQDIAIGHEASTGRGNFRHRDAR